MLQTSNHIYNIDEKNVLYIGKMVPYGVSDETFWSEFVVPKNASLVSITCVGGGGSGAGGGASAAGVAAGGGGGGSGGGFSSLLIPAFFLPSSIYIFCGCGASPGSGQIQGGAAATAGNSGGATYISASKDTQPLNVFLIASGGLGGNAGNGATAGSIGTATSAFTFANAKLSEFGIFTSLAGGAGVAGGSAAAGTAITYAANSAINTTPGCGGGGVNAGTTTFAGGAFSGANYVADIAGGTTAGGRGRDGYNELFPELYHRFTSGGTGGGGATSAGTGGSGGNGGFGSGGAGGGAANGTSSIGGAGGNGGPGYVFIRVIM